MYESGFLDCIRASAARLGLACEFADKANGRLLRVHSSSGKSAFFGATPLQLWPFNGMLAASVVNDKELTIRLLRESGIAVPETAIAFFDTECYAHLPNPPPHVSSFLKTPPLDLPAVIKPNDAKSGRGLAFVYHRALLDAAIACAAEHSNGILMQELLHGRDIRLYAYRGRGILRIERSPLVIRADGRRTVRETLADFCREGEEARVSAESYVEAYGDTVPAEGSPLHPYPVANYAVTGQTGLMSAETSPEEGRICRTAYEVLDIDFCAIDCLQGDDGVVRVFEVNANPGIKMLYHAEGHALAHKTIDYLVHQAVDSELDDHTEPLG